MNYIIYSGGADGYGFYESSASFPESYKSDIKKLYETNKIVSDDNWESIPQGIRMSPLKDKYLISVIYRGCTGNGEKRKIYAGINWLFDNNELEEFFSRENESFSVLLMSSNDIMNKKGYVINHKLDFIPSLSYFNCHKTQLEALITSAYSSTDGINNGTYQTFIGYESLSNAFQMFFLLLKYLPKAFWKHLKIYIGAASTSETSTSYLVFMDSALLKSVDKNGDYVKAMHLPKIAVYEETLNDNHRFPAVVSDYVGFEEHHFTTIFNIFRHTDNISIFWEFVEILSPRKGAFNAKRCVELLGQNLTIACIEEGTFNKDDFISAFLKNKRDFESYGALADYIEKEILQKEKLTCEAKEKIKKKKKKETKNKKQVHSPANNLVEEIPIFNIDYKNPDDKQKKNKFFGFVGEFVNNKFFIYFTIAVLSIITIACIDVFLFFLSAKLKFESLTSLCTDALFNKYILAIIGLNLANIPLGFTFVASVIELIKISFYKRRR